MFYSAITPKGNSSYSEFSQEDADKKALQLDESNCTNCNNCTNCINCAYCADCNNCTNCTNCINCAYCTNCTNCINCAYCNSCAYCTNCIDCNENSKPLHIYLSPWNVNIYKTGEIKIGCKLYTTSEWENFSDIEIAEMSPCAMKLWNAHKTLILSLAKTYQSS